jgi:hypothetical protein
VAAAVETLKKIFGKLCWIAEHGRGNYLREPLFPKLKLPLSQKLW